MKISDYEGIMKTRKIFFVVGSGLIVLGSYLVYKLFDMDPSSMTCRVNDKLVDCPEHIGALFGAIPAIIGIVFVIIAFVLYIKNRDKSC